MYLQTSASVKPRTSPPKIASFAKIVLVFAIYFLVHNRNGPVSNPPGSVSAVQQVPLRHAARGARPPRALSVPGRRESLSGLLHLDKSARHYRSSRAGLLSSQHIAICKQFRVPFFSLRKISANLYKLCQKMSEIVFVFS